MIKSAFRRLIKPYLRIIKRSAKVEDVEYIVAMPNYRTTTTVSIRHSHGDKICGIDGYLFADDDSKKQFINAQKSNAYIAVESDNEFIYISTSWSNSVDVFNKKLRLFVRLDND